MKNYRDIFDLPCHLNLMPTTREQFVATIPWNAARKPFPSVYKLMEIFAAMPSEWQECAHIDVGEFSFLPATARKWCRELGLWHP
jgi:hypothetical protein